ncbi:MAG: hypothetical protein RPU34_04340 [Candidatus Sedimenticola sp. (ex Thyasira tokunagai)]
MGTQNLTMYTDDELLNIADRNDPFIEELCKRLETATGNAYEIETVEEERDVAKLEISEIEKRNTLLRERIHAMRSALQRFVDKGADGLHIHTRDITLAEDVLAECEA